MMAAERLEWADGWLCVAHSAPLWNEPVRLEHWWPVRRCPRDEVEGLIGLDVSHAGGGVYWYRHPTGWRQVVLRDGPDTRPIREHAEPIPPPRVRKGTPVRYRDGGWEKNLKAKGWVPA